MVIGVFAFARAGADAEKVLRGNGDALGENAHKVAAGHQARSAKLRADADGVKPTKLRLDIRLAQ